MAAATAPIVSSMVVENVADGSDGTAFGFKRREDCSNEGGESKVPLFQRELDRVSVDVGDAIKVNSSDDAKIHAIIQAEAIIESKASTVVENVADGSDGTAFGFKRREDCFNEGGESKVPVDVGDAKKVNSAKMHAIIQAEAIVDSEAPALPSFPLYNRHGFAVVRGSLSAKSQKKLRSAIQKENARLAKWTSMLNNWDEFCTKNPAKLKSRVRKGIPDAVRAHVYMLLSSAQEQAHRMPRLYNILIEKESEFTGIIKRDLHRTLPEHILFTDRDGFGQESLFRVLKAYAVADPEVGYCQGMGAFVSIMLTYLPESDVYWLLWCFMKGRFPRRLHYAPGLFNLRKDFYVMDSLLKSRMRSLHRHLANSYLEPPVYASNWFNRLFSDVKYDLMLRIWDIFMNEGPKIFFRIGLAIMQILRKQLMQLQDPMQIRDCLKEQQMLLPVEATIQLALSISLKTSEIHSLMRQFEDKERGSGHSVHSSRHL